MKLPPEKTQPLPTQIEEEDDPNAACRRIPAECRSYLPYGTYSRFLPRALDLNVTASGACSDHNRRLTTSFHCFLKYPV